MKKGVWRDCVWPCPTGQQGVFLNLIKFYKERQFFAVGPFLKRKRWGIPSLSLCSRAQGPREGGQISAEPVSSVCVLGGLTTPLLGKILL